MQVSAPVPVLLVHVCRLCVGISALTTPKTQHVCVCVQVCMHSADMCGEPMCIRQRTYV